MINLKNISILILAILLSTTAYSQEKELTWEELGEQFECPTWYTEGKLGLWTHWGPQTQPLNGGGWYARHMYMQDVDWEKWGKDAYNYHLENYGHPSEFGYKEVLNDWKAENLDTDSLMRYFKSLGAKFFIGMANHHDHFDNFASTHHPWNSVNIGPKRDIVAEFSASAKKYGLPFGVSSHDDRYLHWWKTAFGADTSGTMKGVPYDGNMTKEDGIGLWWEGLDPADLYGLPPEKRTPEWIEETKINWMLRHMELVEKYDLDMLWFDGALFPYDDYGKKVCEKYYNESIRENGKIDCIVAGKFWNLSEAEKKGAILDFERGVPSEILYRPWQTITTFGSWFYKEDKVVRQNARTIIEIFSDILSKNGVFLLNIELLRDGTLPPTQKQDYDDFGAWVNLNADAIYKSKAWKVYGDNLYSDVEEINADETDLKAVKKKAVNFNERTLSSPLYGHSEVRFTVVGDKLYVFVLNPKEGDIELPSLGLNSEYNPKKISSIKMLGSNKKIKFKQTTENLTLKVPEKRLNKYTVVFEVVGAL